MYEKTFSELSNSNDIEVQANPGPYEKWGM